MPGTKRKMDPPPGRPGECASAEESVVMQLSALKRMTVVELKRKWESLFGSSAPNNSRSYLELMGCIRPRRTFSFTPSKNDRSSHST